MLIGLMALWSTLGTFAFGDIDRTPTARSTEPGIFSQLRAEANDYQLRAAPTA